LRTRSPNILHVIDSLAPGGAERIVVEIANAHHAQALPALPCRMSICVTRDNTALADSLAPGTSVYVLARKGRFDWAGLRRMGRLVRSEKIDLLHVHMQSSLLIVATARMMNVVPQVPIIFMDHNGDVELSFRLPFTVHLALRWLQPWFVGVHPALVQAAVSAGIPERRARTITNAIQFAPYEAVSGVSLEALRSPEGYLPAPGAPVGVVVANLRPTKDHLLYIEALARLKELAWTLLVVGGRNDPEYARRCHERAAELGLSGRILFLGKRLDVAQILKSADFAVLTSKSESGPLVLLEYAAAGLPFVATRTGLIGRKLDELGAPGFFAPSDGNALVHELRQIIEMSPTQRKDRGLKGRALARPRFDMSLLIHEWYALYARALGLSED
jgi:glycosyltransferase involved in cell wall biosynthesis